VSEPPLPVATVLRFARSESPERSLWSAARKLVAVLFVLAFVAAILFANAPGVRSGYPFLDAGPPAAPDGNVDLEMRNLLPSGEELRIWESTRYDATTEDAVGVYLDDTQLRGSLGVWQSGHTQDGRANLLHTRIGQTLIVIVGALSPEELLRIADSLRQSSSSALLL
jgi:hypothetical protein